MLDFSRHNSFLARALNGTFFTGSVAECDKKLSGNSGMFVPYSDQMAAIDFYRQPVLIALLTRHSYIVVKYFRKSRSSMAKCSNFIVIKFAKHWASQQIWRFAWSELLVLIPVGKVPHFYSQEVRPVGGKFVIGRGPAMLTFGGRFATRNW
jgi:hypothetical protein